MSAPRHLWSGDWQGDSAALGDELAAQRARATPLDPSAGEPPVGDAATREAPAEEGADRSPRRFALTRRHLRVAVIAAAITLAAVGVALAVGSALGGGSRTQTVASNHSRAWLGVDTSSTAGGVTVDSVVHGSPAASAGIKPGDMITALDTQPIATPAILVSAIDGMQPGDRVQVQLQRGGTAYTASVVLAKRPGRSP